MRPTLSKALIFVVERRAGLWLAVIGAAVLFGAFEFTVSRWLIGVHLPLNVHSTLHASIVGLGAGIALWLLLLGVIERRRIVTDELHRVAELNHTVRNSLEIIVLAHHNDRDREHKQMILECTASIDEALKRLHPGLGKRARTGRAG